MFIMSIPWKSAYDSCGFECKSARASAGEVVTRAYMDSKSASLGRVTLGLVRVTFIWLMMSRSCPGGIAARVWLMLSTALALGGSARPGGSGRESIGRPGPPGPIGPPGPGGPPPRFEGGESSVSAKSRRRPRPPTSTPWRLRNAEAAVSGSLYSQKPNPLGLPVAWSNTSLGGRRCKLSCARATGEWSVPERDDGANGAEDLDELLLGVVEREIAHCGPSQVSHQVERDGR